MGRGLAGAERRFWLIVGLITLGGAVARFLIHDYGLPWFEEIDELRLWFFGRELRGLPVTSATGFVGNPYPPVILWLHQLVQPLAEAQGRTQVLHATLDLRRLMLLLNVLGTIWFALLGRRLGGAPAGIMAAALWAFETDILKVTVFATGDSLAIPLLALCVLLAVRALTPERRWRLALVSTGLGVLCFLCDYRLLVAAFPGCAALLWRAWLHFRPGWRRALLWCIAGVAIAAGASAFIIARLPARLSLVAQETLSAHLWDLGGPLLFLERASDMMHDSTLTVVLILIFLALCSRRPAAATPLFTPGLLVVSSTLVLLIWSGSALRPYDHSLTRILARHLLPTHLMFMLLSAVAVGQLLSIARPVNTRRLMHALLLAYLLFNLVRPTLRLVQQYRVLPWPVIVRDWVDDNLDSSRILLYPENFRWFTPQDWGLPRHNNFDRLLIDDIRDFSLAELIEIHNITWVLLPANEHDRLSREPEGQALLEQMLLLRKFTGPPRRREPETVLYRLWRMQHESDVRFGEQIRLVGHDLHTPNAGPGDELAFTFYWSATDTPPENYSFFLQLVAEDDIQPLARLDGNPAVPERPTQTWDRPGETLISPRFALTLPPDLAPGDYRVLLGLHNAGTGARLPVRDAQGNSIGDALELTRLQVPQRESAGSSS